MDDTGKSVLVKIEHGLGIVVLLGLSFHAGIMHNRVGTLQVASDACSINHNRDGGLLPVLTEKIDTLERRLARLEAKIDELLALRG